MHTVIKLSDVILVDWTVPVFFKYHNVDINLCFAQFEYTNFPLVNLSTCMQHYINFFKYMYVTLIYIPIM